MIHVLSVHAQWTTVQHFPRPAPALSPWADAQQPVLIYASVLLVQKRLSIPTFVHIVCEVVCKACTVLEVSDPFCLAEHASVIAIERGNQLLHSDHLGLLPNAKRDLNAKRPRPLDQCVSACVSVNVSACVCVCWNQH